MAIEKLIFTSWSDAEIIFAIDWERWQAAAVSSLLEDESELFDFLHGASTFVLLETIGKDLNRWGTYRTLCEEFGDHLFNGSLGLAFVSINLPDIELSREPDAVPLEQMLTPPEEPKW